MLLRNFLLLNVFKNRFFFESIINWIKMGLLASVLNSHCMSFSDFQFLSFALKKDTSVQFPNEITEGRERVKSTMQQCYRYQARAIMKSLYFVQVHTRRDFKWLQVVLIIKNGCNSDRIRNQKSILFKLCLLIIIYKFSSFKVQQRWVYVWREYRFMQK